jgi:hypothetical protein
MPEKNPSFRLPAPSPTPAQVRHLAAPPKFEKPKRIHLRRVLPRVREGAERHFHSTTMRAAIARPLAAAVPRRAATDELALVTNGELTGPAQQDTASNVGEPSTAIHGKLVFYTGNWYAAISSDGGNTFQYLDPATVFKQFDPPGSGFCCDQVVNYIPQIDMFVWLLQYGPESGDNIQRLAFAKTADVAQGKWRLSDLTTQLLGVQGAFLDFPDLAVGTNFLYVTTNIFLQNQAGSAVVRLPLAGIESGQVTAQKFVSFDFQSFRVAQNCGTTAFFAAHHDTSTLQVFSWDEAQDLPVGTPVGVARWIGGNGYRSRTPDGRRWLDRADPRITGATLADHQLWFAWSVDSGSNQRPRPFVQIARLDAGNLTLLENVNVFDPDSAICYGALSTNANNEIGISYAIGGGTRFPSHVVGILTGTQKHVLAAAGERGPLPDPQSGNGEWGDFLTVRPVFPDRILFAATGYTMKGQGDGSNRDCTPRFVIFGRSSDAAPVPVGAGGGAPAPADGGGPSSGTPAAGGGGGDGPIQDVNELPVVSAEVAAKIKAAAGILQGPAAPQAEEALVRPELVTKPGVERWPVKTGTDQDAATVGKNVINGQDLGVGIVEATLEELVSVPRPPDMPDPAKEYADYQDRRSAPVEQTIWRVEVTITAMKLEADGDYHLVLQGASGETMVGEIPTPTKDFVGDSPWITNIGQARQAVDDKFVKHLSPEAFAPMGKMLVPCGALTVQPMAAPPLPASFCTPQEGAGIQIPLFKTQLPATRARITGVGFFDKVHGQTGVSQSNGIELHPVLKIEWL